MAKRIAPFYDITLCVDGSIGVRYLCQVVDDDGQRIGAPVPHRLVVQPDEDISDKAAMQHAALAAQVSEDGSADGFEVPDADAVIAYVAGLQAKHWADTLVAPTRQAWIDARVAAAKARAERDAAAAAVAAEAEAAAAAAQAEAEAAAAAARKAELDAAVKQALADLGVEAKA